MQLNEQGPEDRLLRIARAWPIAAGIAVAALGTVVLLGWALDLEALKQPLPDLPSMKANTALGFVALGLALVLAARRTPGVAAVALALVPFLVGSLTLVEYAGGLDLGIDEILVQDDLAAVATSEPGRMSPLTAASFVLAAASLLADRRRDHPLVGSAREALALSVGLVAVVVLSAYAYGAAVLSAYSQMALHTAAAFFVAAPGLVLVSPEGPLARLLLSTGLTGQVARRLLPAALVVPIGLGAVRIELQRLGYVNTEQGATLFAVAMVLVLSGAAVVILGRLRRLEALREASEARQRAITETAQDAIVTAGPDGRIRHVNPATLAMFRATRADLEGQELAVLMPDRLRDAHRAGFARYMKTREARVVGGAPVRLVGLRRDGTEFPVELALGVSRLEGQPFFTGILRDVTERERDRQALADAVARVELAEGATGRGTWEWDITRDRAIWSKGMYRLFGLDPATFVNSNENFLAMVHPDDRARMGQAIADALAHAGHFHQEYRLTRADGQVRVIRGEGDVVPSPEGKGAVVYGVVEDVTDLRAAEETRAKLQQMVSDSEARLRAIFENSAVGIIVSRRDGTVIDVNQGAEVLWGRSRADFFQPGFRDHQLFADPAERDAVAAKIEAAGAARDVELRMVRGDGQVRVMTFGVKVIQLDGAPAFLATGVDITPLHESERRVQESESRLRAVVDNASDAIITGDATATIVGWNRAAERIFGLSARQAIGRSMGTLLPPEKWADYQADLAAVAKGKPSRFVGRPREMQGKRADGTSIDIELALAAWAGATGPMLTGVVRDITERKAAQAEVARAQQRFATVFQLSPLAICLTKEDGTFVDVNAAFCDLVGRLPEDMVGGPVKAMEIWEDPQERQRMLLSIRARGVVRDLELRIKRPDGEVRTTLASIEFIDLGGGTTILSMLQDITDRLRLEEERSRRAADEAELERLRRSDRFRTEFINNIAHELATPLTPLVMRAKTLLADATLSAPQRTAVETMERNVQRLRHLVDDMVGAADLQARNLALDKRRLNLTRELRAAVAAQQPAVERAGLRMDEPDDTGLTVSADPARLQLVMGHLLGNAIKFTPIGGHVTVSSRRTDTGEVRVEVRDTGVGLTPKQIEGLWRPFSQAHDKSQFTRSGSGLGLYVVKGIVELHGGEVGVSSPGPGHGSTFWFTLPLATGHLDPLSRPKAPEPGPAEPRRNLNPGVGGD